MGATLAAVIVYQPQSQPPVPELVVGEAAPDDVYATHTFTIVREDTTHLEERRTAAARDVPTVFDFDQSAADEVVARVSATFIAMRAHLQEAADRQLALLGVVEPEPEGSGGGTGRGTGQAALPPPAPRVLTPADPMVVCATGPWSRRPRPTSRCPTPRSSSAAAGSPISRFTSRWSRAGCASTLRSSLASPGGLASLGARWSG
jgi:hypothetical protein